MSERVSHSCCLHLESASLASLRMRCSWTAFDRGCARCLLAESHNIIELNRMTPRILIVEDDPDIAQPVVRYLDKGGSQLS